jgi:hypothetical protein
MAPSVGAQGVIALRGALKRRQTWAIVGILAGIGIAWGTYEAGFDSTPPPGNPMTNISQGMAVGNRLTTRSWRLSYDNVQASNDGNYIQAQGVHNAIIYHDGRAKLHLWADHVSINLVTKNLDIRGHVHIEAQVGSDKRAFDTESATWTESTQRLLMPGTIKLSDAHSQLQIANASVDIHTGQIQLGKLNGTIAPTHK